MDPLRKAKHPLFAPLTYRLAGRVAQVDWEEMASDPTAASYAVRELQAAVGQTVVVPHMRLGFEAEACGADLARSDEGVTAVVAERATRPRDAASLAQDSLVEHAMELTRRLCSELRSTAIVMGVLTGPRTLKAMFDDSAGLDGLYANLARGYGEAGIGGLILVEDVPLDDTADLAVLRPLANVASYFGIPVVAVDPYRLDAAGEEDWTLTQSESIDDDLLLQDPGTTGWLPFATAESPLVTTVGEVDPGIPVESLVAWREYVEATSFAERPR